MSCLAPPHLSTRVLSLPALPPGHPSGRVQRGSGFTRELQESLGKKSAFSNRRLWGTARPPTTYQVGWKDQLHLIHTTTTTNCDHVSQLKWYCPNVLFKKHITKHFLIQCIARKSEKSASFYIIVFTPLSTHRDVLPQNFDSYSSEVQKLICTADHLGSLMQYDTAGFLPNRRIHRGTTDKC